MVVVMLVMMMPGGAVQVTDQQQEYQRYANNRPQNNQYVLKNETAGPVERPRPRPGTGKIGHRSKDAPTKIHVSFIPAPVDSSSKD